MIAMKYLCTFGSGWDKTIKKVFNDDIMITDNKFGYFKTSITSNFRKLNSYNEELYPEDDNSSFWDDYKFIDYEGR